MYVNLCIPCWRISAWNNSIGCRHVQSNITWFDTQSVIFDAFLVCTFHFCMLQCHLLCRISIIERITLSVHTFTVYSHTSPASSHFYPAFSYFCATFSHFCPTFLHIPCILKFPCSITLLPSVFTLLGSNFTVLPGSITHLPTDSHIPYMFTLWTRSLILVLCVFTFLP